LDVTSDELGERTVMPFRLDRKKHTDFSKN